MCVLCVPVCCVCIIIQVPETAGNSEYTALMSPNRAKRPQRLSAVLFQSSLAGWLASCKASVVCDYSYICCTIAVMNYIIKVLTRTKDKPNEQSDT